MEAIAGGMITSTIHALIPAPVFFAQMKERALRRGTLRSSRAGVDEEQGPAGGSCPAKSECTPFYNRAVNYCGGITSRCAGRAHRRKAKAGPPAEEIRQVNL